MAVGRISRPHGLRGAVLVEPMSDVPGRLESGAVLLMGAPGGKLQPVRVTGGGKSSGKTLIELDGVTGREGAEALRGRFLYVPRASAGELAEGEYWPSELEGMSVVDEGGERLGAVDDVLEGSAQDILVVKDDDGREILVPFVREFVMDIDETDCLVRVRLIEGMRP